MGQRAGQRAARGDYQTPLALASSVCDRLVAEDWTPATVVEPTCGDGNFLVAAAPRFPDAILRGFEIDGGHIDRAREALGRRATIVAADFFTTDWREQARGWPEPILIIGNPPWVTTADLTALASDNAPPRSNLKHLSGLDARTGKANFDISEWMLIHLLDTLRDRDVRIAWLIKTAVARRVVRHVVERALPVSGLGMFAIDARRSFGVAVDACLFVARLGKDARAENPNDCPLFTSLEAERPDRVLGVREGAMLADVRDWPRIAGYVGTAEPQWRSGIKHDCAAVMELERTENRYRNRAGDTVELEHDWVYPLLKSSDLARGRTSVARRFLVVPQRRVGEPTEPLARLAPALWRYLHDHGERLDARKSRVYTRQPRFAIFGVGDYSFSPWKVAISGLHDPPRFRLLGPLGGRPVVLDDTCYFLGFDDRRAAVQAHRALCSAPAAAILRAMVFPDSKRPITKQVLSHLDLDRLSEAMTTWKN